MKNEKKTRNYEKPEVEVIKLDKDASFIRTSGGNQQQQQTMTIVVTGEPAQGDPFADDGF